MLSFGVIFITWIKHSLIGTSHQHVLSYNPKSELLDIYDKLGYSYLDLIQDELEEDLETFRQIKEKCKKTIENL